MTNHKKKEKKKCREQVDGIASNLVDGRQERKKKEKKKQSSRRRQSLDRDRGS
jgi:hypothetical protein